MHEVLFGKSPIVVIQVLVPTEITTITTMSRYIALIMTANTQDVNSHLPSSK